MKLNVVPIIQDLRDLYQIPDRMDRFHAYVALLSGKTHGEPLPIGNFSPMGQRQADYLDCLLRIQAENMAEKAIEATTLRLRAQNVEARVMLVVVDEPRNGWTQRSLTDATWRFGVQADTIPKSMQPIGFRPWVSVQLWTDVEPSANYIHQETASALFRYLHRRKFGTGNTLLEMMTQEGRALAFAGLSPSLGSEELEKVRAVIQPYLACSEYPICFAALYGDDSAQAVGYEPLGMQKNAGFDLGLSLAIKVGAPEQFLI